MVMFVCCVSEIWDSDMSTSMSGGSAVEVVVSWEVILGGQVDAEFSPRRSLTGRREKRQ